jgi:enterochelin esterase-like enzyme
MRLLVLLGVCAGVLAAGLHGAWSYVRNYDLYRGFPPPQDPPGVAHGTEVRLRFRSPALGDERSVFVYLPPGYQRLAAAGHRLGVLYLLHAAPTHTDAYLKAGALGVAMDTLVAQHRIPPFIAVMPDGHTGSFNSDTEWANDRAGRFENYVTDVVHFVDRHFATVPTRRYRVLAGLSEGAYGAANVTLHQLRTFGAFESWSGYFTQTPTGPFVGLSDAYRLKNSPQWVAPREAREIRHLGLRAYLYAGGRDKSGAPQEDAKFAPVLRRTGADVTARLVPNARHDWGLWRREMPLMLRWATQGWGTPKRP